MSARLGDPKSPVIFLFNTARCGSTLLTQMLEYTNQCVAISEPDLLNSLSMWYRERGETEQVTNDIVTDNYSNQIIIYNDFIPAEIIKKRKK